MKTYVAKPSEITRKWLLMDAEEHRLGRLASTIAVRLMGKHKAVYTPFIDTGDFVVVVNAEKVQVSGNKLKDKKYYRHSGYLGSLKERSLEEMLEKKPEEVIKLAVRRMLPKNRIGRDMLKKLKVYSGSEHPHASQMPEKI